jgi:hypothetical protein
MHSLMIRDSEVARVLIDSRWHRSGIASCAEFGIQDGIKYDEHDTPLQDQHVETNKVECTCIHCMTFGT